jgi:hypothetical protein
MNFTFMKILTSKEWKSGCFRSLAGSLEKVGFVGRHLVAWVVALGVSVVWVCMCMQLAA